MALQVNLSSTQFGVPATEAYVKVMNFNGDKSHMMVMTATYYNAASSASGARPLDQKPYQITIGQVNDASTNVMSGIYNTLKTLPDFSGAIDV